jgi:hypothetical protein
MNKKEQFKLTEESHYRITSIGGRDTSLVTEGIFKGYANLFIDEGGLLMELGESHEDLKGKMRLIPLHAILCIDVLDAKMDQKKDDSKDLDHYYS